MPKLKKSEYPVNVDVDNWQLFDRLIDNDMAYNGSYGFLDMTNINDPTAENPKNNPLMTEVLDDIFFRGSTGKNMMGSAPTFFVDPANNTLLKDQKIFNTDDENYKKYFTDRENEVINQLEEGYQGRENEHETLMALLENQKLMTNSVAGENHGYHNTPAVFLMKPKAILTDLFDGAELKQKTNSAEREQLCQEFGITKMIKDTNEILKSSIEYNNEWQNGIPDAKTVKDFKEKMDMAMSTMEEDMVSFIDKFKESRKESPDNSKIRKMFKEEKITGNWLVGYEDRHDGRAIDDLWVRDREDYQLKMDDELLAAELMDIKNQHKNMDPNLAQKSQEFIDKVLETKNTRNYADGKDTAPLALDGEERINKLFELRESALKNPDDPASTAMLKIVNEHIANPVNSKILSRLEERKALETGVQDPESENYYDPKKKNDDLIIDNDNLLNRSNSLNDKAIELGHGGMVDNHEKTTVMANKLSANDAAINALKETVKNISSRPKVEDTKLISSQMEDLFAKAIVYELTKKQVNGFEDLRNENKMDVQQLETEKQSYGKNIFKDRKKEINNEIKEKNGIVKNIDKELKVMTSDKSLEKAVTELKKQKDFKFMINSMASNAGKMKETIQELGDGNISKKLLVKLSDVRKKFVDHDEIKLRANAKKMTATQNPYHPDRDKDKLL